MVFVFYGHYIDINAKILRVAHDIHATIPFFMILKIDKIIKLEELFLRFL